MRRALITAVLWSWTFANASWLAADVLVFKNGARSEVQSVEITDRAVHFVTLNGKRQSIIRDAIDVRATLAANHPEPPRVQKPSPPLTPALEPQSPEPPPARETTVPATAPPQRSPSPPPPPPLMPAKTESRFVEPDSRYDRHRFALYVNGSMGTSPLDFTDSSRYELFREEARVDNVYQAPNARGIEIGGFLRIKGPVGLGASVELARNDNDAAYSAFLPHPFYFDRYRELSGVRAGLRHEERAVHVDGVLSNTWADRFTLDVFGGPTLFSTKTEVLVDLLYSESYPYDDVVPGAIETEVLEDRPMGYNVGASATYRLAGNVGLDFGLRFSKGKIRLSPTEDRTIEFEAGGLRAGAGLRLLFR